MTKKLYELYPYEVEFDAQVIECNPCDSGYKVVLDQTLFFPEEGGQTADKGKLNNIEVLDVQIKNNIIYHFVAKPLSGNIHGKIDWQHRYSNMQNHTGDHILSALIKKLYDLDNIGFHLGNTEITADYNGILSDSQIKEIEEKVNQVIFESHPVTCYYPKDITKLIYRSKIDINNPRIVEIKDVDICACCAPHVRNTIEVGLFKIIHTTKIKHGTRIFFLCGQRAYQDYKIKHEQVHNISTLLSSKPEEVSLNVKRINDENHHLTQTIHQLEKQIIDEKCKNLSLETNQIVFVEEMNKKSLIYYFNQLIPLARQTVFLCSKTNEGFYFMTNSATLFSKLKIKLKIQGGGSRQFYQGSIQATQEVIETIIMSS